MYLKTLGLLKLAGSALHRPKPLLLLAYLALEGQRSRRYIAELFYQDTSDPMNNLSRALSHLKEHAPETIQADHKSLWVTIDCDANDLLNLTQFKDIERVNELYQGTFLMDYSLPLGEELEEWVYTTREILAQKARSLYLALGEQEVQRGDLSRASLYAEKAYRLSDVSPLEPSDFNRVYNLLQLSSSPLSTQLSKEAKDLGIELSPIQIQSSLQEKPLSHIDIPHNLPLHKSSFVGREQELSEIHHQLAKLDCRLLTLHGMGGIGKSRTSTEVAYQQLQQGLFSDGIYFIALDGIRSADLIPSTISEQLDMDIRSQGDVLTQLKEFIGQKKMLLILDNFEHLMDGATLPSNLLSSCPNLNIIITSREVLNVDEEWVKNLEGLRYPTDTDLNIEEAQSYEAIDLFTQRAKKSKLEFSPTEENISTIIQICQLVEGVPLALELAATWVRFMTPEDIAQQIKTNLSFLTNPIRNAYERHKNIQAVFEYSWKLLSPKEQEVLRKLSIFAGSFSRQAAAEVAGATLPILASLVNKSLLRVMPNGRYTMHFLIHEFGVEKLKHNPNEHAQTQQGHAGYYLEFLSGNSKAILGGEQKRVLEEIESEVENIYEAWPKFFVSEHNDNEKLRWVINTMCEYLKIKGGIREGIKLLLSVLNDGKQIDTLILGTLNRCIAWFYKEDGKLPLAQQFAEQSIEIFNSLNFPYENALALRCLGYIYLDQGKHNQAKKCFFEELSLHKDQDNIFAMGATLNNLGYLHSILGEYDIAESYILESIQIDRKAKNISGLVIDLDSLGTIYLLTKQFKKSEDVYREALNLARELNDNSHIPFLLNGIGKALYQQNKLDVAKNSFQYALKLAKKTSNHLALSVIFTSLGMVELDCNNSAQAEDYLTEAISIAYARHLESEMIFGLVEVVKLLYIQDKVSLALDVTNFIIESPCAWKTTQLFMQEIFLNQHVPLSNNSHYKANVEKPTTRLDELVTMIITKAT